MPAGRPTDYNPNFINAVPSYLETTGREQTMLPTRVGFARYLGIHRDTLDLWTKTYPDFSDAVKVIDDMQQEQLMNDGLYGGKEVNSSMAIFLLKANHKMVETSHTDITTKGQALPQPLLAQLDALPNNNSSSKAETTQEED